MRTLMVLLGFFFGASVLGQSTIFNSAFKGNFFIQAGSSMQFFNPSTLRFTGNNFDFSLNNARLTSLNRHVGGGNKHAILTSAYSLEVGHNIKRGVMVSANIDQMGYGLNNQTLEVTGSIAPGIDQLSGLPETSNQTLVSMDSIGFNVEISRSNRFSINLNLCQNLYRTTKRGFVLNAVYGFSAGVIHSTSTITFGNALQPSIKSLSGISASANAGLRFEFLRHFYLLTQLSGVLLSNHNIRLDLSDGSQALKGNLLYGQTTVFIGSIFSLKNRKSCDCPKF